LSAPAIVDIDGDGKQEIITGNRIHKFRFNSLSDHTQNTYTTIEGPKFVTVPEEKSNATYYYLSDGFTRVADIDGDGKPDIIVVTFGNSGVMPVKIVVYVWDLNDLNNVKACVSFGSEGEYGKFSIPFIGDINGKLDGYDGSNWTRKLPEICILGGGLYINRANTIANRTGVSIHPKSSGLSGKFNNTPSVGGHIIGLTWDDNATTVETKLKVSWGMEHTDRSDNTGITLFDFDNNNTADLCYRDETTLRIISPARSGKDYVTLGEGVSENSSVMFTKPVYSGTAFEYPVIADVNLDGSADIVVTNIGSHNTSTSRGWIEVYEYKGQKWAPCPPVWNQGMYDPTQVREDLKINARPISMLTEFEKGGEIIRPYNGSWMQTPITREGDDFVPVVRKPDAILTNMTVSVISATVTKVTLTIRNDGSASISASTPIAFYDAGTDGKDLNNGATTLIGTQPVGVDIFPDEKVTVEYTIGGNFNDHLIWAQVMDNGSKIIPANGYDDCNITNNTLSGIDCPYLKYTVAASPDSVLCGTADNALLTATPNEAPHHTTQTYQWYRNDVLIPGATLQTYTATLTGEYKCFVTDNICRGFSTVKTITRNIPTAVDDYITVRGIPTLIDVLKNDIKSQYCSVSPTIASEDEPKNGTAVVQPDGSILYTPNTVTVETKDSIKYTIADSKATVHITLLQIPQVTLPDTTILCISSELRTTKVNVMANDPPNAEGNTVYLTGAEFVDASDATLAYITVNPADSTVTLTVKQDVYVGVEGHTFDIIYHVKDNGLPASQYAIGRLAVKTYPTPSYPDIRVRVCPDAGNINLSKYLDTINGVKTNGIQWSSQIQGMPITSPAGTVSTDNLSFARVHTFAYTLGSVCVSEQQRKVYLEMLKNNRINIFRDTVVMCYRYADAVQIDQLFGIEANGKLSYLSAIDPYVKKSSDYGGTVMNGKKIYENDAVPDSDYHGVTVKKIEFKYTPDTNSCLSKTYTIVIVLTPDLLN
jgi:hypothetical protein